MKKLALAASVAAMLSTSAQADMLFGVYAGAQVWNSVSSGEFGEGSNQLDFGLDTKAQGSYFVAVEHPIPLIPNIKLSSTSLATEGNSTVELELWGTAVDGEVSTDFDVSYNDYTLYYELFDNGLFSFDFGVTARDFESAISVTPVDDSADATAPEAVSVILPMAYVYTNIGIPATGFNIYGTGNLLSVGDNSLYDYEVGVSYELLDNLALDVNITAGYREVALELDEGDLRSDLQFKGAFAGVVVHF